MSRGLGYMTIPPEDNINNTKIIKRTTTIEASNHDHLEYPDQKPNNIKNIVDNNNIRIISISKINATAINAINPDTNTKTKALLILCI